MVFHNHAQPDPATASAAWVKAIAAGGAHLHKHAIVDVLAASAGWIDTGLDLREGEEASLFSAGTVWLAKELGIGVNGGVALWHRIGTDGIIAKSIGTTTSFRADRDGRLMLIAKPPGEWLDETGRFEPGYPHAEGSGALTVAVLVWPGPAREGLTKLRPTDESGLAAREIARLDARVPPAPGWRHLWRLGETQIFRAEGGSQPWRICCHTTQDVGILQYPVDVALDRSTRLAWAWKAEELPSKLREDSLPTHDYLSIAVEFDNGRDLTYMWSAALPEGKVFPCPLPWWDKRETHQVVRSDLAKLGQWLEEEQPVLDDYERAIGGEPPKRIVGIWLIAVSIFQKGKGICSYA
ncbi:MAG TPA: DUF3047 domain-containing protein, partial [Methylocella sp.]|nr:DUF3047 domain-containing protein [Methylocella sp.]